VSGAMSYVIMLAGIVLGFVVPPMVVRRRISKRREAFESQLVELCEITASMPQSGYGYTQALTATANEIEPPLADELKRMLDKVRLGGDVDEALEELTERLDSSDFEIVSSAIAVQRRSGGNLSDILMG